MSPDSSKPRLLAFLIVMLAGGMFAGSAWATIPAQPSNFTGGVSLCSANAAGLNFQWTDNATNEVYYEIYRYGPGGATDVRYFRRFDANTTGAYDLDSVPSPGEVRRYWLYAWNTTGYTFGIYVDIVGPAATTAAPSGLNFSFPQTNNLRLTWTDNSTQEAYYEIAARDVTAGGSFVNLVVPGSSNSLGQVPWNLTSYELFYYLQPGRTYEVKIQSFRYAGNFGSSPVGSGYSNPVTIVVPGTVNNAVPTTPTNLTVAAHVASSVNRFGLYWDDLSDETGFEIAEKLGGAPDTQYVSLGVLGGVNGTNNPGIGLPLANSYETSGARDFRIRAIRGNGPFAIVGAWSTAAGADMEPFNAPTDLRVTAPADNGLVNLFWNDNATTETGYDIEYRVAGSANFTPLQFGTSPNFTNYTSTNFSRLNGVGTFPPSTQVEFRVRATRPGSSTAYATASVTMPPMNAPTNLAQGAAGAEGTLNLTWTDNSGNELGYAVEARKTAPGTPDADFFTALFTNPNVATAALTTQHIVPGYTYELRVRAVSQVSQTSPLIYSNPSNLITRTSPFNAPTNLRVQSGTLAERSVTLNWNDNSSIEQGYLIYSRPGGTTGTPAIVGAVAANATTAAVGLTPAAATEFFVAAYVSLNPSGESTSAQSNGLTVTGRDAMTSPIYLEVRRNEPMSPYSLTTTTGSAVSTRSITSLPAGLSFNSTTGQITGTPTGTGVTTSPVQVTFANGWTHNNSLAIRILQSPAANAFPAQTIALGTPVSVPLADKFSDPDASSAARVNTNLSPNSGNMDFIFFDGAAPLHVANFMGYANRGDYVDTIFHRSIAGFISQGGAFRAGTGAAAFTAVPTQPSVTNEPGLSNVRGTVALAKLPTGPSTGTNQFFVNLGNNGPNLDFQNGGFTVFARVTAPGMAVADALAALPTGDYNVTVDGAAQTFEDFPVNSTSAPASMNNSLVVKINSVTSLPVLSWSITSNSNSGVVSASIVSGSLSLTPVAPGTAHVVVRATDLEGGFVETTVPVTVNNTLSNWAAGENLPAGQQGPGDDPDRDGRTNLLEYALMTAPGAADGASQPVLGSVVDGADNKATITFKVRKFAALTYVVQGSGTMGAWSQVWTSADGFSAANVISAVDHADHTLVTVRDTTAYTAATQRFLRVTVTSP